MIHRILAIGLLAAVPLVAVAVVPVDDPRVPAGRIAASA